MDPATWAAIGSAASTAAPYVALGAAATGAIISAQGAKQQAQAQSQAGQYQAAVANNNQVLANQYADQAKQQGEVDAQRAQMVTAQREGSIRAAIGASGVDPSSGSGLRLQEDTRAMGGLDAATIRSNAAKTAYGYQVQGTSYGAQAELDRMGAVNAGKAGDLAATGAIISGGASVSDKWLSYKKTGVIQ